MMDAKAKVSVQAALRDRVAIERACIAAARDAARLHRFHNVPMAVWRDGKVVEVSPDEFEQAIDEREAKLNAEQHEEDWAE